MSFKCLSFKQPRPRRQNQQGFTLIEMLVTLVLTAIITTVLMQGMGYLWRLQNRYNLIINQASVEDMRISWWRDSIKSLNTVTEQSPERFHGDERSMQGLSLSVIGSPPGVPALMHWQITAGVDHAELVGNQQPILELPAGSRFVYLDEKRQPHSHWPVKAQKPDEAGMQLPSVILIQQGESIVWAASPLQPQMPKYPETNHGFQL